jgi:hypothetical protein
VLAGEAASSTLDEVVESYRRIGYLRLAQLAERHSQMTA